MPDFEHFRFPRTRMNASLDASAYAVHQPQNSGVALSDPEPVYTRSPDPGFYFGEDSFDMGFLSNSFAYLHPSASLHRASFPPPPPPPPPPGAAALRNDLGSNISVLKTLNLRFRCFLDKVHELERRNKALESQLQQALEANNNVREGGPAKRNGAVHSAPDIFTSSSGVDSPCLARSVLGPSTGTKVGNVEPGSVMDSNCNLPSPFHHNPVDPMSMSSAKQGYDGYATRRFTDSAPHPSLRPTPIWFHNPPGRFSNSWEFRVSDHRVAWPCQDGVGVQIDTVTPEIRALNNVLAKVKQERDKYKQRWEEEYAVRMDLQERIAELEEDLYMSEMCQDKLALRVKQLKAELIVFKSLMSNNLSELDSKIQEKAMKVDMDICRRIDITARLCDVAQQRNCEDMTQIFQQVATPPSTLTRGQTRQAPYANKPNNAEDSVSLSESEDSKIKEAEPGASNPVNEEMQRILNQLHDCEFEDDCDSLAWEETEETLLLWGDFPGCTIAMDTNGEQDESIEKVIMDTESMFQSREKEYQETIDQIELELATAKSDMNRHLHEYMEMCSMKRGLDVQMETCRRLITQSGDRKTLIPIPVTMEDAVEGEQERMKASLLTDGIVPESCCDNLNNPTAPRTPWRKN